MKVIRNLLLWMLGLSGISALLIYLNLNRIVSHAIESSASSSLRLQTTVGGAHLSMRGGHITVKDLRIANPGGSSWPELLAIGRVDVTVSYDHLTDRPIRVGDLSLQGPILVIESFDGKFNSDAIRPDASGDADASARFVIDKLTMHNAKVLVRARDTVGRSRRDEAIIFVPELMLENVGANSAQGISSPELARRVIVALAERAAERPAASPSHRAVLLDAARSLSVPAYAIRSESRAVPAR